MTSPFGDEPDDIELIVKFLEGEMSNSSQGDEEITNASPSGDEPDLVISDDDDDDDEIGSLMISLFPPQTPKKDKRPSIGFSYDAIKNHISNCARRHKRSKADVSRDIVEMVYIGLKRGNIKSYQLQRFAPRGAARTKELACLYQIPMESSARDRMRLQSDTLTFARAVTCFPQIASTILSKKAGYARNGAKSTLASEQLPDAMRHSGFGGLIPKDCDLYLKKAYVFAHTAYMVDFNRLINPGNGKSSKALASSQIEYSKVALENSPHSDEFRAGSLKKLGLTDPVVFKKIVDVCNNLCKAVGKPELAFETAEEYHIKNGMICFFEDDIKDVADAELDKMIADELSVTSIHDASTSTG